MPKNQCYQVKDKIRREVKNILKENEVKSDRTPTQVSVTRPRKDKSRPVVQFTSPTLVRLAAQMSVAIPRKELMQAGGSTLLL